MSYKCKLSPCSVWDPLSDWRCRFECTSPPIEVGACDFLLLMFFVFSTLLPPAVF
jgi:hypothetical protein